MVAVKIAIGSDKSGFYLKEFILARLSEKGIEITDLGTADVEQPHPFFEVASIVGKAVSNGEYERAILICGTGMGMSQVANKFRGVLAACCETTYSARMCRAINNSNILCMGGWVIGPDWIVGEVEKNGERFTRAKLYRFMIKYVVPVVMLILFLTSTGLLNRIA